MPQAQEETEAQVQPAPKPARPPVGTVMEVSDEELAALDFTPNQENQEYRPPGVVRVAEISDDELPEEFRGAGIPTVTDKIVGRFLGTDVEDPMEMARIGSQVTGSLIGAYAGSRIPTAPGVVGFVINPITGAIALGGLGGLMGTIAPESTIAVGEAIGFLPKGTLERKGLSPSELQTVLEGEALLEIATSGGLSAIRMTGRGISSALTGIKPEGRKIAGEAAERGIALLPIQVGKRSIARGYVSVMGRFPVFGTAIRRRGQESQVAAARAIEANLERMVPFTAWNEVSQYIFDDAVNLLAGVNKQFSDQYDEIFEIAETIGVRVTPEATIKKGEEILELISSRTPRQFIEDMAGKEGAAELTAGNAGPVLEQVANWIRKNITSMAKTTDYGRVVATQDFRQMDGLQSSMDQFLSTLEPGQQRFALSLMTQLQQATKIDMLQNVTAKNAEDALHIAQRFHALDQTFSHTMSELFENSAALRFGSVQRRGLRAAGAQELTRIPVDKLAKTVIDLQSPQMIGELSRIVSPETMGRIAGNVIHEAVEKSSVRNVFDPDRFASALGLDSPTNPLRASVDELLKRSGSDLTTHDFEKIVQIARVVGEAEIPDISTFIARRVTLGGLKAGVGAILPATAIVAGGSRGFGMQTLIGIAGVIGGGKLVAGLLSNPNNARFLKEVLSEEATDAASRKAWLGAMRGATQWLIDEEMVSEREASDLERWTNLAVVELSEQLEQLKGSDNE